MPVIKLLYFSPLHSVCFGMLGLGLCKPCICFSSWFLAMIVQMAYQRKTAMLEDEEETCYLLFFSPHGAFLSVSCSCVYHLSNQRFLCQQYKFLSIETVEFSLQFSKYLQNQPHHPSLFHYPFL